jgi:hypothetical protein
MLKLAWLALGLLVVLPSKESAQKPSVRKTPCKVPELAKSCYWTHARLQFYNGTPALRLWKIGTRRVLGVYSGPLVDRKSLDNEDPELPENVSRKLNGFTNRVFGDFEICPLEPEKPHTMQAVCIESANNLAIEAVAKPRS